MARGNEDLSRLASVGDDLELRLPTPDEVVKISSNAPTNCRARAVMPARPAPDGAPPSAFPGASSQQTCGRRRLSPVGNDGHIAPAFDAGSVPGWQICSWLTVRLLESLHPPWPCWQREDCLQELIEPVPTLQFWVSEPAIVKQRMPTLKTSLAAATTMGSSF